MTPQAEVCFLWERMQALQSDQRRRRQGAVSPTVWLTIKKLMAPEPATLSSEEELRALLDWILKTRRELVARTGGTAAARDLDTTEVIAELIVLQANVSALALSPSSDEGARP